MSKVFSNVLVQTQWEHAEGDVDLITDKVNYGRRHQVGFILLIDTNGQPFAVDPHQVAAVQATQWTTNDG